MTNILTSAAELEARLGDARDASLPFSYAQRVADDEAQRYPEEALALLTQLGLQSHYVPRRLGGQLDGFDRLGALVRVVARRDLGVAISHAVTFLGSMGVWVAGDAAQQRMLADAVLDGERVSLALTEETAGSDLLAMLTRADANDTGFRLHGRKWLVNGLSRNRFALVYARTADRPGPRGFDLFLVDRARDEVRVGCRPLPKITTLGVRGADISGMRFDVQLAPDARIGAPGTGFETVLRGLQLSRTLCGALSLGALDTALGTVLRFALERPIYGRTVSALAQSRRLVAESWAELLVADSVTTLALRGLHAVPGQASVHSAIVKFLVPTLAEQAMQRLAVVHGARWYLRDHHEAGIFQKMLRDNLLIGLFDGSTQVNLYALAQQVRALAQHAANADVPTWVERAAPLTAFDASALALGSGGRDAIFASLPGTLAALRDTLSGDAVARGRIEPSLQRLTAAHAAWLDDVRELTPAQQARGEPQAFEASRRYAVLWATAALLADYQRNRGPLANGIGNPAALAVALQRLTAQLGDCSVLPTDCYAEAFEALIANGARDATPSIVHRPETETETLGS